MVSPKAPLKRSPGPRPLPISSGTAGDDAQDQQKPDYGRVDAEQPERELGVDFPNHPREVHPEEPG